MFACLALSYCIGQISHHMKEGEFDKIKVCLRKWKTDQMLNSGACIKPLFFFFFFFVILSSHFPVNNSNNAEEKKNWPEGNLSKLNVGHLKKKKKPFIKNEWLQIE
ncbi:hypothetical protein POVWA1_065270 [Plasmodium ovale wallikeri]|uniref:Uncharacterized protein n=1 Tax=Plasmodium ovale wallikeri TaxID=864142 RepID=A0A1A9ACQ1_PLAOA|nr:hypothetical protein POVWA1_065270 [Plasmodium ovale wallikeri]